MELRGTLNRRNAMIGWAVLKLVRSLLARRGEQVVPEPPEKHRRGRVLVAVLALAALGAVAYRRLPR